MRTPAAVNAALIFGPFFHQSWLPNTAYTGFFAVSGRSRGAMASAGT